MCSLINWMSPWCTSETNIVPEIAENAQFFKARSVPILLKEKVEKELDRL